MKHLEHQEQVALFECLAYEAKRIPALSLSFAIPNGGHRMYSVAKKLKAEGVKAGVPDIFIPIPSGSFHGLFLEMKIRPNKPTILQQKYITSLRDMGYFVVICYSATEALETIKKYLAYGTNNNSASQVQSSPLPE